MFYFPVDHTFDSFAFGYYAPTWRIIEPLLDEDTSFTSTYAACAREDELLLDLGGCLDSGRLQ